MSGPVPSPRMKGTMGFAGTFSLPFWMEIFPPFGTAQEKGSGIANTFSFDLGILYTNSNLSLASVAIRTLTGPEGTWTSRATGTSAMCVSGRRLTAAGVRLQTLGDLTLGDATARLAALHERARALLQRRPDAALYLPLALVASASSIGGALLGLAMPAQHRDAAGRALQPGRLHGGVVDWGDPRAPGFAVACAQLGAAEMMLSPRDMQLGRGEPIRDTARVLSRYLDALVVRTFGHDKLEEIARFASVPVVNALTDASHPCQVLADLLTVAERFGADALAQPGLKVAWIGDGNNMANSWLEACSLLGFELALACPAGYDPDAALVAACGGKARVVRSPAEAAAGAHVLNTDVWASMGQEAEQQKRHNTVPLNVHGSIPSRSEMVVSMHHPVRSRMEEAVPRTNVVSTSSPSR